jgi:hypothetical protein
MNHEYTPGADHVETALEATCAVLMTLESLKSGTTGNNGEPEALQSQLRDAVALLREAIAELRLVHVSAVTSLGFILGSEGRPHTDLAAQARPRRTA